MNADILQELVTGILTALQEKVVRIILYGSAAKGTSTEESDIDVALLVNGMMDNASEDRLSDFIVDMNLKYDKVFSVIDIDIEKFMTLEKVTPFYQSVNKEGIVLWKAV